MTPHADLAELLELLRDAAQRIGLVLTDATTGGGSDGCFTGAKGVPTIDGLGPVGGGYHTRDEFIEASTLAKRATLSAAILATLNVRP
jgi:glutamate carboxypeptidase